MIEFKSVHKRFGSKVVLDGVDLTLQSGEIVFVIGKSGMGKSVLLKHVVGLMKPDAGEVWVEEAPVWRLSEIELQPVRRKCGMVFQFPALLDSLTVFDNIAFGIRAHFSDLSSEKVAERVKEKLDLVNLPTKILNKYPLELSFSTQKRVAIARTLAVDPTYLLFDEPTTGMDPVVTTLINELILKLCRQLRLSALVVSHDMHCALAIADRIVLLDSGKIVVEGPPQQMIFSENPLAIGFLQEAKEKMRV